MGYENLWLAAAEFNPLWIFVVFMAFVVMVLVAFFLSMGLHAVTDLLLHHDDAHRHFLPISGFRFESPVSYWDPAHYGTIAAPLEAMMVLAGALLLWRRYPARSSRILFAAVGGLYVFYLVFAVVFWLD